MFAVATKSAVVRRLRAAPPDAEIAFVRPVRRADLERIVSIDATVTGLEKRKYWNGVFRRYGAPGQRERQFLVAQWRGEVVGFVIGEVRDWEFGSPPCGWVFAIDVQPDLRLAGVGTQLFEGETASDVLAAVRRPEQDANGC